MNRALIGLACLLFTVQCQKKKDLIDPPGGELPSWLSSQAKEPTPFPLEVNKTPLLIRGARILTATGKNYEKADLLVTNGRIQKISEKAIKPPKNTEIIEGEGLTLTPGLIDVHSHMGVFASPQVDAHQDGNEMSRSTTGDVWAEHGFWPQDPDLWRALAGGVTTIQVLPGSGNHIGGRSFVAKLIPKVSAREMRVPGAPQGLKMACGENPKRVHRQHSMTRMGNIAQYRKSFQEAKEYMNEWDDYFQNGQKGKAPKRNFVAETLAQVIRGDILLHFHCYRADDINAILDVADEFGFKIRTVHHGLEAYKIAQRLKEKDVAVATWADWWGFKAEAFDGIPTNVGLLQTSGARPIVHSDSALDIRFLNIEAAKALSRAREMGLELNEDHALAWITANPAWALGLEKSLGTLEEGKIADIVAWNGSPFSVYSETQWILISGKKIFDRKEKTTPTSDFEIQNKELIWPQIASKQQPPLHIKWPSPIEFESELAPSILIKGGHVFYQNKWDQLDLLLQNGKIKSIQKNIKTKDNLTIVDAKRKFIAPHFVELNTHLGLMEIEIDSKAQDLSRDFEVAPSRLALDSLNTSSLRIPLWRRQGVGVATAHNFIGIAGGQSVAFSLETPTQILQKQSHLMSTMLKPAESKTRLNRSELWSQLRQLIWNTEQYLKSPSSLIASGLDSSAIHPLNLQAMEPYLKGIRPWVFQIERRSDIENLLRFKQALEKRGWRPRMAIWGGAESWLIAKKLAKHKIPVLLATTSQTPTDFDKLHARPDLAASLEEQGVEVILVDDSHYIGAPRLRQQAGLSVRFGHDPAQALLAITQRPAEFLRLKNQGQLIIGELAQLGVWSADPLEPSSVLEKLWINGKSQNLKTRQDLLFEKYRPSK